MSMRRIGDNPRQLRDDLPHSTVFFEACAPTSNEDFFLNQVSGVNPLASSVTQGGIQAIQCPACSRSPIRPALETYHSRRYTNALDVICTSGTRLLCPTQPGTNRPIKPAIKPRCRSNLATDFSCRTRKHLRTGDCSISVAAWEIFLPPHVIPGSKLRAVELNQSAVRFARETYGLREIFAMRPEEFRAANPDKTFDVVTFFEVLEHQDDPQGFLKVAQESLASGGYIALSVPNRTRWQKGVETLDYPPNHLTRWSPLALRNFLEKNGFEVLSMKQEPLNIGRAAQVLSMGLRTGLVTKIAGEKPPSPSDLAVLPPAEMEKAMDRMNDEPGHRLAARLAAWKTLAMIPAATAAASVPADARIHRIVFILSGTQARWCLEGNKLTWAHRQSRS